MYHYQHAMNLSTTMSREEIRRFLSAALNYTKALDSGYLVYNSCRNVLVLLTSDQVYNRDQSVFLSHLIYLEINKPV